MFDITDGKGFHIKFENGWTVSVQFGRGNYCDHYRSSASYGYAGKSETAEIAAWDKSGEFYVFEGGDNVRGYVWADEVARFIKEVSMFEN